MRTLSDAKDIRARLLKRVQIEQPDAVEEQVYDIYLYQMPLKYGMLKNSNIKIVFYFY